MDVKKLTAIRKELGFSQAQMAKELGVHRSYYNQVEGGREPISSKVAERAQVLESEHATLKDSPRAGSGTASVYSHYTIETLQKTLIDLSAKLPTVPEAERPDLVGHIQAIGEELNHREKLKQAVAEVKEHGVVYGRPRKVSSGKDIDVKRIAEAAHRTAHPNRSEEK